MAWAYLDVETTSLEPKEGQLLTIQWRDLSVPNEPLKILRSWKHPDGERGIITQFIEETRFWTNRFKVAPCGWNLDFDLRWLYVKSKKYGLVPWDADGADYIARKPRLDLQQWAILCLGGELKGSRLDAFSGKVKSGASIQHLLKARRYAEIDGYIREEADAFIELYHLLLQRMPEHWATLQLEVNT